VKILSNSSYAVIQVRVWMYWRGYLPIVRGRCYCISSRISRRRLHLPPVACCKPSDSDKYIYICLYTYLHRQALGLGRRSLAATELQQSCNRAAPLACCHALLAADMLYLLLTCSTSAARFPRACSSVAKGHVYKPGLPAYMSFAFFLVATEFGVRALAVPWAS
jgi:hypothetical protein